MTSDNNIAKFKNTRILLVEDNEINQLVAKKLLTHLGLLVTVVANGEEAVGLLKDSSSQMFDLIFMDILMPIMDGREACRLIRRMDGPNSKIPIIALSANDYKEEKEINLSCGMDGQIKKPIELDELLEVIFACLNQQEKQLLPSKEILDQRRTPKKFKIEGIDTDAGLSRVVGNAELYEDLLEQFSINNRSIMNQFYQNFRNGRYHQNEILAHTVKGTSGTLGAMALFSAAEMVEQACRRKDIRLLQLKEFDKVLTLTLRGIDQHFARASTHKLEIADPKNNDMGLFEQLVQQLISQLHNYDAEALKTADTIMQEIDVPEPLAFLKIVKAINNLDFEFAVTELEAYAETVLST